MTYQRLLSHGNRGQRGFTLLEVVLALALAVLLLATISTAIYLHLNVVEVGRSSVEQAQLARVVLGRMADDLRSALRHETSGEKEITSLNEAFAPQVDSMLSEAEGSSPASGTTTDSSGESGTTDPSTVVPHAVSGLYGDTYELQLDITRLPRPDEYAGMVQAVGNAQTLVAPHDVRTVAYFLDAGTTSLSTQPVSSSSPMTAAPASAGLVRQEMNRAVGVTASEQGTIDSVDRDEKMLSAEVTALEFRYFDGTEWLTEWNSDERGGLPMAVEIAIAFAAEAKAAGAAARAGALAQYPTDAVYRLVVSLPAAEPTEAVSTTTTDTETTSNETTSNATTTPQTP